MSCAGTPAAGTSQWRRWLRHLWPLAFWLAVWQLASVVVNQEILLASPGATLRALGELVGTAEFWGSVGTSLGRILAGFFSATVAGVIFAALSARFSAVRSALAPFVQAVKAAPVASFVILVLIWVPSRHLSIIISFLMVFPIIYTNVLKGIAQTDAQLLEMARVFDVRPWRRITHIYVSQALAYFQAGCALALGLCWKSGIAAEVIGLPANSIGEHLYEAKVYLDTPDLFAWTLVIIVISLMFEKVFTAALNAAVRRVEEVLS